VGVGRIPWELDAEPIGSADHTLGTTVIDHKPVAKVVKTLAVQRQSKGERSVGAGRLLLSVFISLW